MVSGPLKINFSSTKNPPLFHHFDPQMEPELPILGTFGEENIKKIKGIDFTKSLNKSDYDFIYESLIKNQVIFITNQILSPTSHLNLAKSFGEIESSHPVYPHLKDFPEIVLLENNSNRSIR